MLPVLPAHTESAVCMAFVPSLTRSTATLATSARERALPSGPLASSVASFFANSSSVSVSSVEAVLRTLEVRSSSPIASRSPRVPALAFDSPALRRVRAALWSQPPSPA